MSSTKHEEEGTIQVPGGNVWYKSVGGGDLPPLLVMHGGPGFTHNYLTPLEDLADRRRVIFWDQLGCGKSETPHDSSLWTMDRSLREVDAVRDFLKLERHHLFGNSWGGMLAQQYVLDRQPDLISLVISNSLASVPRMAVDTARLKGELPQDVQDTIDYHEDNELYDCPEYQGAIAIWYQTYICRMKPWPKGLEESFAGVGMEIYTTMIGPSDFKAIGNLRDWDILDRLHEIVMPTLFIAGRYDECTPENMKDMHERVSKSQFALFEESAHMPFYEERQEFMRVMNEFVAGAESET